MRFSSIHFHFGEEKKLSPKTHSIVSLSPSIYVHLRSGPSPFISLGPSPSSIFISLSPYIHPPHPSTTAATDTMAITGTTSPKGASPSRKRHHLTTPPPPHGASPSRKRPHFMPPSPSWKRKRPHFPASSHVGSPLPLRARSQQPPWLLPLA
ncbi:hypothetical protein RIF29_24419 [Crotalaria pallida]|uniref:Uncharacterized protein n=1 Tax=Crotalaria pallida TaxID=3830 RepID=A0AAN9EKH7_CROPI